MVPDTHLQFIRLRLSTGRLTTHPRTTSVLMFARRIGTRQLGHTCGGASLGELLSCSGHRTFESRVEVKDDPRSLIARRSRNSSIPRREDWTTLDFPRGVRRAP